MNNYLPWENLSSHEKCVVDDLSRLLAIKNQSKIDALQDFGRVVRRIERADYSELGKLALLQIALEIPSRNRGGGFGWDISGMLCELKDHDVLPDMASTEAACLVASAFHVQEFNPAHMGWLLDHGLRVEIPAGLAMPLIFLCVALDKKNHFNEAWSRCPMPFLVNEDGYTLLACSLMKTSQVAAGFWKILVDSGARFQDAGPNGKTAANVFSALEGFPSTSSALAMKEVRSAIDAELLSVSMPCSRPATPKNRL